MVTGQNLHVTALFWTRQQVLEVVVKQRNGVLITPGNEIQTQMIRNIVPQEAVAQMMMVDHVVVE